MMFKKKILYFCGLLKDKLTMSEKKNDETKCFAIMPISDCDGYANGHFAKVYEDIIKPAIIKAGFTPKRADEESSSNLIQLGILNELLEAPMAICDLSSRNPNVMFELGIRQAFDMPVAMIQEKGTPSIFDIAGLRYVEYSKTMEYREVLEAQEKITDLLKQTYESRNDAKNINSIVKLLAINSKAQIPSYDSSNGDDMKLDIILSQLRKMNTLFNQVQKQNITSQITNETSRIDEEIMNLERSLSTLTTKYDNELIDSESYLKGLLKIKDNTIELTRHPASPSEQIRISNFYSLVNRQLEYVSLKAKI